MSVVSMYTTNVCHVDTKYGPIDHHLPDGVKGMETRDVPGPSGRQL